MKVLTYQRSELAEVVSRSRRERNNMNIYDISKMAGVSIATVSRVLNGSDRVSEKTRKKVLDAVEETNYIPNVFARGLTLDSMKTVGIMVAETTDRYFAKGVYYTEEALKSHGYDTILNCSGYELEDKQKALEILMSKRIDAAILIGSNYIEPIESDRSYILDASERIPIAIVNGFMEGDNIYCTFCNDFQATFDVTNRLMDAGREKIVFLYQAHTYSCKQKMAGFRAAYQARAVELDEERIVLAKNDLFDAREKLADLRARGIEFDAIVTAGDNFAVAANKFAKEHGIKVPDDLFIVGYDNSELAVTAEPEITSFDSKVEVLSAKAVDSLVKVLNGREASKKICVSGELIQRETTNF